ncbi:MFS transporter [Pandoraea apista]|jgi:AAHS family 4-hydroxybenzoate transporter-like MFS transporter|uniref:MFS transporter n=1 Tax=Burkholderiaceae TaxID=119060 RepID=UPI000F659EFD|nr:MULTISPECIES: MFS transporter [Burkholderiaceae]RSK89111.1 MFS transporter [Pandoraea apista]CAJ0737259.1 3-hydroxybenzoate transporter MhbT [Ralstonia mannitolilytica]
MSNTIPISAITDHDRLSGLSKRVIALLTLVMLVDSFDQAALAFAAPSLIKAWGISALSMGSAFSLQLVGLMIGGILLGYVGDRFGRKVAVVWGMYLFGILSLATAMAGSLTELLLVRFLVGLAVGGVVPNAVALCNEFSPKRYQVTMVALIFAGYTLGGAGGGIVSAWLIPTYGWQVIFIIGGIIPIIVATVLAFALPESIKFLAMNKRGNLQAKAARIAALMRPDLRITAQTVITNETVTPKDFALQDLFSGKLRMMTPLLWLLYIANSIVVFALISWMPTIIESAGFPPKTAAIATAVLFCAAAVGGLVVSRFVDRFGLAVGIVMPAIGIPFVIALGMLGNDVFLLYVVTAMAGFSVLGLQNTLHGVAGAIYPTSVRANGVGWALSVAKIGAIAGPFVGGILMASNASVKELFLAAAIPLVVCIVSAALLTRLYNSHVDSDTAVASPPFEQAGTNL